MSDWTRQEAIELSGLTAGRFEVLERLNLIQPTRIGHPRKPIVMYSNKQIIAIRAYAKLRERYSMQELKETLEKSNFLNTDEFTRSKRLLAWKNKVEWIEDEPETFYKAMTATDNGQFLTTFSISDLIEEIEKDGKKITDFEERLAVA